MSKNNKEKDIRFNRFGVISFTAQTKVNDFIDYLENGKVAATRCNTCGAVFFPPRADCCHCLSSDMQWEEIVGAGRLTTYSRLEFAPVGFEDALPYTIALLDYGEFRVFGHVDGTLSPDELSIGMAMKTAAKRLPSGQLAYVFRKI